ncbi:MAG: FKBP-type peptidyl-prolyl cis-trans isomerase [Clostridium sp.]|nr:MAG: FKBP-type peptidyl-prolyl cis-trans isomerase [Clostridium sp.]
MANGDYAVFDFEGSVDGKVFEGGSAKDYELKIGSGQFIPGFEDQMVGMKAGETKDVNVTFPENYGAKDLAGKAAVFKVSVHKVLANVLPELTDAFVESLKIDGVKTIDDLKKNKKDSIEANKKTSEKDRQVDTIINTIFR